MDKNKTLTIQVKDNVYSRNSDDTSPLLETLENHNIAIPSHCREGFCGVCRTQILSGSVEYIIDPLAYIDDDEILPCCCRPTTCIVIKP